MKCHICGTELNDSDCVHYNQTNPLGSTVTKKIKILDDKLSISQQRIILEELTDLRIQKGCKIGIVFDEKGDDFFGFDKNSGYDFTTIRGIIKYISQNSYSAGRQFGKSNLQRKLKNLLEL